MINYSSYEDALNKEGYFVTDFQGNSMYPVFLKNDLLIIIKSESYNLYDIVLYKNNDRYVIHRIVDINDVFYIIRGDNTIIDEKIFKNNILGKVNSILRGKEEININDKKNIEDYNRSLKTLKYRRFKNRIRKLLFHE